MTVVSAARSFESAGVRGFFHAARPRAGSASGDDALVGGLVLTHGAGGDSAAPVLVAVAEAFAAAGVGVLRCDLAFRIRRPKGPPSPGTAAADREGLRLAVAALRTEIGGEAGGRIGLGGHSYGGRQASMLAAEDPAVAGALLLLSYPLHPPAQPEKLRTNHFPQLRTPAVFVHGPKDTFATADELTAAVAMIPAATRILPVPGASHDLKRGKFELAPLVETFLGLFAPTGSRGAA